jgi:ABC-type iron transport system FetAB ATPase subunit
MDVFDIMLNHNVITPEQHKKLKDDRKATEDLLDNLKKNASKMTKAELVENIGKLRK